MALLSKVARNPVGRFFVKSTDEDIPVPESRSVQSDVVQQPSRTIPASFGAGVQTGVAPTAFVSPSFSVSAVSNNVDPETRAKVQLIADGVDQVSYTKFRELLKNMAPGFSGDEASLYRSALAAGKAFGIPYAEVLRGVDAILGELVQAETKMKQAAPQRIAAKVGVRREKISQLRQSITLKREQVERLQQEVAQLSQVEQAEQAAISQDEQSVREDTEKFLTALEAVRAPYVGERQKIELYGKGV